MNIQTALRVLYPPRCLTCGEIVDSDQGLCGPCWRETPFITGFTCDLCGLPLPGGGPGEIAHCDECLSRARPWVQGRAAMLYDGNGRRLVLALKHGDRQDMVAPCGHWLAQGLRGLDLSGVLIAPVPLHRWRLIRRRYNQSALLARALAAEIGAECCPDLLWRPRATRALEGLGAEARFAMLDSAIVLAERNRARISGRKVLLVDDVMTTGATLAAASRACLEAGAGPVSVVTLARAAKAA